MSKLGALPKATPEARLASAFERIAAALERIATVSERYLDDTEVAPPKDEPVARRLAVFGEQDPPPPTRA